MNNQLTVKQQFEREAVDARFKELLGDKAPQFIASVIQATNSNPALAKADPSSVINGAAMAAVFDLPINNNIGEAFLVPYNQKQPDGSYKTVAQFQLGYKGFIQLALRSGMYETLSATKIHKSQFKSFNPLTDELILDGTVPPSGEVIGYAAYFELKNGFKKVLFMTVAELQEHGKKYSKTYGESYSLWSKNFEAMAIKTVLKMLINKWGMKSMQNTVIQQAMEADQSVVQNMDGDSFTYPDNAEDENNTATDINADFTPHEEVSDVDEEII